MYNAQTDVLGPLDLAYEAVENGNMDEALLHLGMARARASRVMASSCDLLAPELAGTIHFPSKVTRFEVIDHGRTDGARCFVTNTAEGGEISIQDNGRTAKLFIKSTSE